MGWEGVCDELRNNDQQVTSQCRDLGTSMAYTFPGSAVYLGLMGVSPMGQIWGCQGPGQVGSACLCALHLCPSQSAWGGLAVVTAAPGSGDSSRSALLGGHLPPEAILLAFLLCLLLFIIPSQ